MNKIQLLVMRVGIAVILLMGVFPPWMRPYEGAYLASGYAFILTPPRETHRIDASHLCVQWAIVAFVTCGLIYTFKDKKPKDDPKQ
jgi:hypothetical protein